MKADDRTETNGTVHVVVTVWRGIATNVEVYSDQTEALDRYLSLRATINPDGFADRDFYYFEKEVK